MHDDGGFSGGMMERPALKRLLEEVGKVNVVVVHKVDRLTRWLFFPFWVKRPLERHSAVARG